MSYPAKLEAIISLFEGLPDPEKRETLIAYSDQAKAQEPGRGRASISRISARTRSVPTR